MLISQVETFGSNSFWSGTPAEYCHSPSGEGVWADASRTPAAVTDELFAALQERFDAEQLVELTAGIAWENWRARFNWAFDIGATGFREGAACPVPVHSGQAASAA